MDGSGRARHARWLLGRIARHSRVRDCAGSTLHAATMHGRWHYRRIAASPQRPLPSAAVCSVLPSGGWLAWPRR
jgi:hypothetical protein